MKEKGRNDMKLTTAQEWKESLVFSKDIAGVSITISHELFEKNFHSWFDLFVREDWHKWIVTLSPDEGEPVRMTEEEYNKL